jgi:hypothetical protein
MSNRSYTPPVGVAMHQTVRWTLKTKWISVRTWVVVRYIDYCGHLSTLYVNKYIPWQIFTRFKSQEPSLWSRKEGLFVVLLWILMYLCQLFTACGIATMRQPNSQGGLDKVVDVWQSHRITEIWPSVRCGIVKQLPENYRRVTGVSVSDQTVRNRLREFSSRPRCCVMVWGGISIDGRADLVIGRGNLTPADTSDTVTACVGYCIRCCPWILTHARQYQGSCSAHHQSCLARTGHSRDGMSSIESWP